jgi:hypothetical protein
LVERFYAEFEAVYEELYRERYGFWRPIIGTVVRTFLECGDLKYGFARVRQFVCTIPKRLRIYFRFDRRLLGELCLAAARTVITVYRAVSGRPDAVPGMVGAIQTFGQLVHWHPYTHALVTEGVFLPDGTFLPLRKLAVEPFLKLWEQEVFALLLAEGKITEDVVANMRSWKHSGFSVDQSVRLAFDLSLVLLQQRRLANEVVGLVEFHPAIGIVPPLNEPTVCVVPDALLPAPVLQERVLGFGKPLTYSHGHVRRHPVAQCH